MNLVYSQEAKERLCHLHPEIKKGLRQIIESLRENPYSGKPLRRELEGFWSVRFKQYRVIYRLSQRSKSQVLEIYTIGRRERVYEDLVKVSIKTDKWGDL